MKYLKERYLGSRTFVLNIESFNYHYEEKKKYTNHDHFFLISQHERELFNFSRYYAYIPLWDPPPPPPPYFDRILSSMAAFRNSFGSRRISSRFLQRASYVCIRLYIVRNARCIPRHSYIHIYIYKYIYIYTYTYIYARYAFRVDLTSMPCY